MWAVLLGVLLILLAALSAGDARAATPTSLGDRTLEVGMVGRDVRHLQLRLKRLRLLDAPATARFGARTRAAVRRYQRSRCLKADGIAGAATIRALRTGRRACRRASGGSGGASSRPRRARQRYRTVALGTRPLARGARGRDVRTLQRLLGLRSDGIFGNATKRAVRRFQRRAGLHADGAAGPATLGALAGRRMRARTATYYGPGLYGNRTACGQTMTRRLRGVAHKTLPCGTPVVLHHSGRFVTTRVVDRGPFVDGVAFDLTIATARQLGLDATARIRAAW
jgi:peptidoglycan hydrolase-like protein with peptidoglycan-binding domain